MKKLDLTEVDRIVKEKHHGYGTSAARTALDLIIGQDTIKNFIESYLLGDSSQWLISSIIRHLQSPFAAEYCYRIVKEDSDQVRREGALYLLKELSDIRCLQWFQEFITDENQNIQYLTICMLDQFYFCHSSLDEDIEPCAKLALKSKISYVKKLAGNILKRIEISNRSQEILERAAENEPGLLGVGFNSTCEDEAGIPED